MNAERLHISIEPSIRSVERIALLQEDLDEPMRQFGAEVVWTKSENLRINLLVFEGLEGAAQHRIRELLRELAPQLQPLTFRLRGTRMFPSGTEPRLLLTDVADGVQQLQSLRQQLAAALPGTDDAAWTAEPMACLLGRIAGGGNGWDLSDAAKSYDDADFGTSPCNQLVLVLSDLVHGRARSRVLERIAFGGAAQLSARV